MFLAGVAHLAERHLAKVEVASSNLVARSIHSPVYSGEFFYEHPAFKPDEILFWSVLFEEERCIGACVLSREAAEYILSASLPGSRSSISGGKENEQK